MEEFSHIGASSTSGATTFMYLSFSAATASTQQPPPPTPPFYTLNPSSLNRNPNSNPLHPKPETAGSFQNPYTQRLISSQEDAIKAKIISHPQYSALLGAYMDCQKVGAPPEVDAKLSAIAREIEARQLQAAANCRRDASSADPELDQFMEAYRNMLVKYREELTRPLQAAMDFLRSVDSQLNSLSNGATASIFSSVL